MKFLILLLLFSVGVSAQTFYKTPSGEKYHTSDCRMVKNKASALDLSAAVELGLTACKICKPAVVQNFVNAGKAKTSGEKQASEQCNGLTKQGTRCKHQTKIGNGYCFQHQPDN